MQNRRDKAAARRFFRRLMKKTHAVPRVIVTDKLRSYGAAHREVMPSVEHRQSKDLNNRAENSHQPTRQRERAMKGFRSVGGAQRFLSAFSGISPHFRPRRHLMTAADHRAEMTLRFAIWDQAAVLSADTPRLEHRLGTGPPYPITRHTSDRHVPDYVTVPVTALPFRPPAGHSKGRNRERQSLSPNGWRASQEGAT